MRDYNKIQFRSPSSRNKANATTTVSTTVPKPFHREEKKQADPPVSVQRTPSTAAASNTGSTSTTTTANTTLEPLRAPSPQNVVEPPSLSRTTVPPASVNSNMASAETQRLRNALDEAAARDSSSKAALAKSDAVILELRSSVRQLKRQLEKQNGPVNTSGTNDSTDAVELREELDKAHAQILTADMVRRELEDTLEAEQYTWELRVQDQERTIQQLQQECTVLTQDLEQCRTQWKEAEDGWNQQEQELNQKVQNAAVASTMKDSSGTSPEAKVLQERLNAMEMERTELQSCLDEALKELEAVDQELQGDGTTELRQENQRLKAVLSQQDGVMEGLLDLYRWLTERSNNKTASPAREPKELLAAIRVHLEKEFAKHSDSRGMSETKKDVEHLEEQLNMYRNDLQAREESSAELRASLKEAVGLLKPLQDAVAKADREKARLQEKHDRLSKQVDSASSDQAVETKKLKRIIDEKDMEAEELREKIEKLEIELSHAKLMVANNVLSANRSPDVGSSPPRSASKAREELKAKRDALLRETQNRYAGLNQRFSTDSDDAGTNALLENSQARVRELESESKVLRGEMAKKDVEMRSLEKELHDLKSSTGQAQSDSRIRELKAKLVTTTDQLKAKKEAERALNRSLKEALGLLQPLQLHLEEAEHEKQDMAREIHSLRERLGERSNRSTSMAGNPVDRAVLRDLEHTVRQLEMENTQLHDALEDMSQSLNVSNLSGLTNGKTDARLREEFVQVKSRYEVTKGRLEDAYVENQSLVEGLKKRDMEEKAMVDELHVLRTKLKSTEAELDNAKFIATSALVKVEELTMANVEQLSLNSETLYKEKAREVESEMKRQHQPKVPYRLT